MTTKIYTRKGDEGKTNLYDIRGVPKSDNIFDVLGDLDELSANIGHLCSLLKNTVTCEENIEDLRRIQLVLLNIGSDLSTGYGKRLMTEEDVINLEARTDDYNDQSPKLTEFILQGSEQKDAVAHICRTICRRVERNMWKSNSVKEFYENNICCFKYMNRLSSFFFAFARYICKGQEITRSMYDKKI